MGVGDDQSVKLRKCDQAVPALSHILQCYLYLSAGPFWMFQSLVTNRMSRLTTRMTKF